MYFWLHFIEAKLAFLIFCGITCFFSLLFFDVYAAIAFVKMTFLKFEFCIFLLLHEMQRHVIYCMFFFVGHASNKIDEIGQQISWRQVVRMGLNFAGS